MNPMTCGYRNATDRMVIARCLGPQGFYLERVVFPFELLSFECPDESELEIWSHGIGGAELVETIRVCELMLSDQPTACMNLMQEAAALIEAAA